jgi:carbamoylphosphate synthase large subunit
MNDRHKPTVLLCDAAFSAIPILGALKGEGYRVAVCGSRASDPGHGLADLSLVMDYGDREGLLRTVRNEGIKLLVPGCTDVSYLTCAWVANQLHLPGYDTLEATHTIHRKDRFRELCRIHQFATPRSTLSPSEVSQLKFPILVKPSDSFSGKGIVKVERPADLSRGIDLARLQSGTRSIVFEEFIEGNLYSHSAILQNGKIVIDFFVNEYCTVHPYQVNSSHLCVDLENDVMQGLREWLEAFARILNLVNGLVHTQFISNGNGFYLIEVTRRCPGDLYALLIEKSTGVEYAGKYAASFCGVELSTPQQHVRERRFFSRHTVSVDRDCVFLSTSITVSGAKVLFVPLKRTGEPLRAAPMDRAGIYFMEHTLASEMKESTPKLKNYVIVETLNS